MKTRIGLSYGMMLFLFFKMAYGLDMKIGPDAGLNKSVGDGGEYWKLGFTVGIGSFIPLTKRISVGGLLRVYRMIPDGEAMIDLASSVIVNPDGETNDYSLTRTSGSLSIIEMAPAARILFYDPNVSAAQFFFEGGVGLYMFKNSSKAEGRFRDENTKSNITVSFNNQWESNPGIHFGLVIQLWKRIEIKPHYTMVFTSGKETQILSFHIGYLIELNSMKR